VDCSRNGLISRRECGRARLTSPTSAASFEPSFDTCANRSARPKGKGARRLLLGEGLGSKASEDELLRSIEVARLLNVSSKTIARWAADEGLPCIRTIGGHRRYYWADVAEWLEREAPSRSSDPTVALVDCRPRF
jgi:excisionase family DNA binding protein